MKQENTFRAFWKPGKIFKFEIDLRFFSPLGRCCQQGPCVHWLGCWATLTPCLIFEEGTGKPSGKQLWDKNEASAEWGQAEVPRSSDLEERQSHDTEQRYVVKWQKLQGREKSQTEGDRTRGKKGSLRNKEAEPWNRFVVLETGGGGFF